VHPEERWLELKLPASLAHLANTSHGRYRLSCPVRFTHRGDEWAAQVASGAVRYDIAYQITRHHAACVVLGRRALGLKARRRSGVPAPHRRMEAAGRLPAGVESYRPGRADTWVRAGHDPPATRPGSSLELQKTGGGDRTQVGVQVAQDRSVPPVSGDRR
jgi:hypothetical protein